MKTTNELGIVTNINDPAKAGRVKCSLQVVDGSEYPEWIEPLHTPGWIAMPNPGDTVEVIMPEGDDLAEFAHEIKYRGQLFDESHAVPDAFQINYPKRRGFFTKVGHLIIFDDTDGSEEITIAHKGVLLVSLTNSGIYFGTQAATENFILGQSWKTMVTQYMSDFLSHTHSTGVGPTSIPLPPESTSVTNLQTNLGNHLSDFIFGQKTKP